MPHKPGRELRLIKSREVLFMDLLYMNKVDSK